MNLPLSWLKDYMNTDGIDDATFTHMLTMSGSMVEGIENPSKEINNVVVGKILSVEPHPDADKLVVCQVEVGEDAPIQIVTGAPNVFEGAVVPVAKHKSTLPGGIKITKGKLRGVTSMGMMCSTDELGISDERATGILILPEDTPVGANIVDVLGLNESVAEFEITSNRPDCMSIIGLARETAATFDRPFSIPEIIVHENAESIHDYASVEIQNPELCSRFVGRVVKNVTIAPSPEWMQRRLKACGIRAINNVVDITNYIMLEYGQPMHAYDLDHVAGRKIIVRNAKEGEKLETLDDQPRELQASMIAISDTEKAIGVAGVMGGANSEVSEDTTLVMFEAANFHPVAVRRGAKALGMRTEASALFEKGLDAENCMDAINRACQLMEELGAGEVVGGIIDLYPGKKEQRVLPFEPEKMNRFLGLSVSEEEMIQILNRLDFKVEDGKIFVPTFRNDIEGMADVAEEVARIYGYEKIPTTMMQGGVTVGGKNKKQKLEDAIRDSLCDAGLYETVTYSFIDPKENDMVLIPESDVRRKMVVISNPLGEENSVMRTDMLSSMMKVLRTNYNRRNLEAGIFEIGTVYLPQGETLPRETQVVAMGMYGMGDFYDLKGKVEQLLEEIGIFAYGFEPCTDNPSFHPGRCASLILNGKAVGVLGQVHPKVAGTFKVGADVYCALLDFEALLSGYTTDRQFKQLPKFPATSRDIAVLLDASVNVGEIEKIIKKQNSPILEGFKLFDVYQGEQVDAGKKSVAYSLSFRADDRTLTDDEVNAVMEKILADLEKELSAQLR
ncbi:MAG: phenylalanine--tRNA ligase subunit beta [Clostridia bacterium]|nr:phenylalanine--tRNA ligase subunit beta [Clostridia bacterium]